MYLINLFWAIIILINFTFAYVNVTSRDAYINTNHAQAISVPES